MSQDTEIREKVILEKLVEELQVLNIIIGGPSGQPEKGLGWMVKKMWDDYYCPVQPELSVPNRLRALEKDRPDPNLPQRVRVLEDDRQQRKGMVSFGAVLWGAVGLFGSAGFGALVTYLLTKH